MGKAFVIGSQGLVDELALAGVEAVGGADPAYATRVFGSEAEFLEVGCGAGGSIVVERVAQLNMTCKTCLRSHHPQPKHNPPIIVHRRSRTRAWARWCAAGT